MSYASQRWLTFKRFVVRVAIPLLDEKWLRGWETRRQERFSGIQRVQTSIEVTCGMVDFLTVKEQPISSRKSRQIHSVTKSYDPVKSLSISLFLNSRTRGNRACHSTQTVTHAIEQCESEHLFGIQPTPSSNGSYRRWGFLFGCLNFLFYESMMMYSILSFMKEFCDGLMLPRSWLLWHRWFFVVRHLIF